MPVHDDRSQWVTPEFLAGLKPDPGGPPAPLKSIPAQQAAAKERDPDDLLERIVAKAESWARKLAAGEVCADDESLQATGDAMTALIIQHLVLHIRMLQRAADDARAEVVRATLERDRLREFVRRVAGLDSNDIGERVAFGVPVEEILRREAMDLLEADDGVS